MKKYKLTNETTECNGVTLYRIKALKDFANVKKGDKGGFVQSEDNLSQFDNCWVYENAKVYGNACVFENVKVFGNANVFGNTFVFGSANVYGNAVVYENAKVYGFANVYGDAKVYGFANVYGNSKVYENVKVRGNADVYGRAEVRGNAEVGNDSDYIVFKNWWSSGRFFTWTRSNNMWKVGCFYGIGEELIRKAYADSEMSGREYERIVKYVESILNDNAISI